MIIAQTAAAVLNVRLLHVNAVSKFVVTRFLLVHARGDVFLLESEHAFVAKLIAKFARELAFAGEKTRFEH